MSKTTKFNSGTFASKPNNRRGIDISSLSPTVPYDGPQTSEMRMNNVTFRVRKESQKIEAAPKSAEMLSAEEIKDICLMYQLTRGQVYSIRSAF